MLVLMRFNDTWSLHRVFGYSSLTSRAQAWQILETWVLVCLNLGINQTYFYAINGPYHMSGRRVKKELYDDSCPC